MQKSFVTSDGATLGYVDEGEGEVLLLLAGWSQSVAMFRHQMVEFGKTRRVLALDFRGQGVSVGVKTGYRISRLAADVANLFAHERIERASVIGWSMGASVLWAFIDQYGTGQLDRLVFVDEPASVMRQAGMSDEEAADAGALFDAATLINVAEQVAGPDGPAARESFLRSMVTKEIPEDLRAWLLAENLRLPGREAGALLVNHCAMDWRDLFAGIDRQTLVIGGEASHVSVRSQRWIHAQIPGAELVVFEASDGGAHFPFIEAPASFNAVVGRFLDAPS